MLLWVIGIDQQMWESNNLISPLKHFVSLKGQKGKRGQSGQKGTRGPEVSQRLFIHPQKTDVFVYSQPFEKLYS